QNAVLLVLGGPRGAGPRTVRDVDPGPGPPPGRGGDLDDRRVHARVPLPPVADCSDIVSGPVGELRAPRNRAVGPGAVTGCELVELVVRATTGQEPAGAATEVEDGDAGPQ